jgi:hypothetical protein
LQSSGSGIVVDVVDDDVVVDVVVDVDVIVYVVAVVDVIVGVVVVSVVLVIVDVVVGAGAAPPQPERVIDIPKSTSMISAVTADSLIAATRY